MPSNMSSPSRKKDAVHQAGITPGAVIRFALVVLLQPAILFGAAGRLDWWMGWIYMGLFLFVSLGSRVLLQRKNPDLIAERASSMDRGDVSPVDKAIVSLIAIFGPMAGLLVAGLDYRLGWTPPLPPAVPWIALILAAGGLLLGTWAMLENRFFSAVVRIQTDRGQTVVTTGPYRFVRHPSYVGGAISFLFIPFFLNTLWALIPSGFIILGYLIRTMLEDRTLQAGLPGYAEYARRVRYRLVPGIW
ncbi:MAG: isoprenylcysteine carboxylmethyltransferase family protein [Anaerolineales bacterium]